MRVKWKKNLSSSRNLPWGGHLHIQKQEDENKPELELEQQQTCHIPSSVRIVEIDHSTDAINIKTSNHLQVLRNNETSSRNRSASPAKRPRVDDNHDNTEDTVATRPSYSPVVLNNDEQLIREMEEIEKINKFCTNCALQLCTCDLLKLDLKIASLKSPVSKFQTRYNTLPNTTNRNCISQRSEDNYRLEMHLVGNGCLKGEKEPCLGTSSLPPPNKNFSGARVTKGTSYTNEVKEPLIRTSNTDYKTKELEIPSPLQSPWRGINSRRVLMKTTISTVL